MARPIVAPVQRATSNIRKVLIVDDDDELRESLRERLSLHDEFDMQFAATASEGLKLASSGYVDLILLDVGLPDIDGRETCKLLRPAGFNRPIIMLTGQTSEIRYHPWLGLGCKRLRDQAVQARPMST